MLNVLVAVGMIVALSGFVLRSRAAGALFPVPDRVNQGMFLGLGLIFALSTILRRVLGARARLRDPLTRGTRFYWGHVVPALVGAGAAVLGFAYGWLISPRLEAILPFWLAALVLGVLSYPRGRELDDFDTPDGPARRTGADDAGPGDPALGLCRHRRRLAHPLLRPPAHPRQVAVPVRELADVTRRPILRWSRPSSRPRTRRPRWPIASPRSASRIIPGSRSW